MSPPSRKWCGSPGSELPTSAPKHGVRRDVESSALRRGRRGVACRRAFRRRRQPPARPLDRSLRRRAAFRPGPGHPVPARARDGHGRAARRGRPHRQRGGAADLRQHPGRSRGHRPHARARRHPLRRLGVDAERPRVPGGRTRDGAQARGLLRPDHPERRALRAHRGRLRGPRERRTRPRAEAPGLARPRQLRARRRAAGAGRQGAAVGAQPAPGHPLHAVLARTCSPTRASGCCCSRARPISPGSPGRSAPAPPQAAASRGHAGKWAILNTRSSVEPFLTYSERRDLREKVWRTYVNRGDNGDAHDNNAIVTEILQLRFERAKLLGYETHAHWRLENSMAKTPERALELLRGGLEAGGGAGRRGGRRHAGGGRPRGRCRGRRASRSSPGTTASTPRRCARRSTTSTRRAHALPAARPAARGHVLRRWRSVRLPLQAGRGVARRSPRRPRLGGHRPRAAPTSGSSTSIPTPAPASTRAPG